MSLGVLATFTFVLSGCSSSQFGTPEELALALSEAGIECESLDFAGSADYQFGTCTDDSGGSIFFSLWPSTGEYAAAKKAEYQDAPLSRCIENVGEILVGSNWTAGVSFSAYSLTDLQVALGGEILSREDICRQYR